MYVIARKTTVPDALLISKGFIWIDEEETAHQVFPSHAIVDLLYEQVPHRQNREERDDSLADEGLVISVIEQSVRAELKK